jgi:hypothetical protein
VESVYRGRAIVSGKRTTRKQKPHQELNFMLKHGSTLSLSIAAVCLAFFTPWLALAATPATGPTDNTAMSSADAQQEAGQMVSAQAHLVRTLDAQKASPGQQFEAIMDQTVHLKDGTELPHGTVLIGKVATDQMPNGGSSRLALLFTEAKLKSGKTVPVRVMIAGVAGPSDDTSYLTGAAAPPTWNHGTLQVDEINALNDVDLHSRIVGANSGVFVTTKKDDVKLQAGSQFSLAIATQRS